MGYPAICAKDFAMSTEAIRAPLNSGQRRQVVVLTLAAVAVFSFFRWLPTGTNLSHGDFRLDGDNVLEFCDPAAPQFLPVTTARSPVTLKVSPELIRQDGLTEFEVALTCLLYTSPSPRDRG